MTSSQRGDGRGPRIWLVPTEVWAYGLVRALAAGVPVATGYGGIGLSAVVAVVLYVFLVRGSRVAWSALLVLDVLSLVLLVVTQSQTGAPWLLHILIAGAIVVLLLPATRAWVTGPGLGGAPG